jgi:pyrroloquinoline quinone biosynthesis protein D
MGELAENHVVRLAPGCRLGTTEGQQDLLLIPEGALRLKGPARDILELCNGNRVLSGIVEELRRRYPSEDAAQIKTEVVAFLSNLRDRGVLEFV